MKLQTALEIIEAQYKYLTELCCGYSECNPEEEEDFDIKEYVDGDSISQDIVYADYQIEALAKEGKVVDMSKIHVTQAAQQGGEGEGDQYCIVFKIDHPEHGVGYIQYYGYYDSWNGTDWDGKEMAEPYEVISTAWRPAAN